MSVPTEIDFAIVRVGNGAEPEVFTTICDLTNVSLNETVNTSDRFVRDCAKPNKPGGRRTRVNGQQWDLTGSGLSNADQIVLLKGVLGKAVQYEIVGFRDDGTDAGAELGTWSGEGRMTARNYSFQREGDTSMEVTIAGHDDLAYAPAA
jgi:hypothetical protein